LLIEKTTANDFGRKVLDTLKAEQEKEDAKAGATSTSQVKEMPAVLPSSTAQPERETPTAKPTGLTQKANEPGTAKPAEPPQSGSAAAAAKATGAAKQTG